VSGRWIVRADNDGAYDKFCRAAEQAKRILDSGLIVELIVRPLRMTRTLDQNAKMWAMLTDIARQIPWIVNDRLQTMTAEEWKDVLTASLTGELRVARGIDGGIVLLGLRTSRMTIRRMTLLIELMLAFGSERGVVWSDPEDLEAVPEAIAEDRP
jgi:hypothetical protein